MTLKAIMLHGTVVIDAYLVAGLGEASLAAMGLAAAVAGFVLGGILAFSNAMQIRTAQAAGSGDPVYLKSALAAGLTISLLVGAAGLAAITVFGGPVVAAMAPSAEVAGLATRYLSIFSLVIIGEAFGQCMSSYFNGCGRTRLPLYSFCLSLPVNVAASVVLIHGLLGLPAFGVAGAAMGSAIAASVQVAFLGCQPSADGRLPDACLRLATDAFCPDAETALRLALPIAATFFSATFATPCLHADLRQSQPERLCRDDFDRALDHGDRHDRDAMGRRPPGSSWRSFWGNGSPRRCWMPSCRALGVAPLSRRGFVALLLAGVCLSANLLYQDLSVETRSTLLAFLPILLILPFPKGSNAICGNTLRASGDTIYVMHIFVWSQWLFRVPATALAVPLAGPACGLGPVAAAGGGVGEVPGVSHEALQGGVETGNTIGVASTG